MTNYIVATPIGACAEQRIPVIPVMSIDTERFFAHDGDIEYTTYSHGATYQTGPLKPDTRVDILALSQASELINKGVIDVSTIIDDDATISSVYIDVGGSTLRFSVRELPIAKGQPHLVGDTRGLNFLLNTDLFLLTENTRDINGRTPEWVRQLHLANAVVNLRIHLAATLHTVRGYIEFGVNEVVIDKVSFVDNHDDTRLNRVLISLLDDVKIVGVDLEAYFTK